MKKTILFLSLLVLAVSCSNDKDENACNTCTGANVSYELCDNGNGTYTLLKGSASQTLTESDFLGISPKQYVEILCTEEN